MRYTRIWGAQNQAQRWAKRNLSFPSFCHPFIACVGRGCDTTPHRRSYNLFRAFTSNVMRQQGPCINKSLITFVAISAQCIYNSCPAPSRHYAVVIILFVGYGLIKLPLMISLTRIHYDEVWRSQFNQKLLPNRSVAHLQRLLLSGGARGGLGVFDSPQPITCWRTLSSIMLRSESGAPFEQEALSPYHVTSRDTIRKEQHSTEQAKDFNMLSLLNLFPIDDSGFNISGWTDIHMP